MCIIRPTLIQPFLQGLSSEMYPHEAQLQGASDSRMLSKERGGGQVYTVCTQCKRVRLPVVRKHSAPVLRRHCHGGDDDQWITIEDISGEQVVPTSHNFSHGLCCSCFERMDKMVSRTSSPSPTNSPTRTLASSTSLIRRPSIPSSPMRVLVVDDNKLQRLIHKRMVEQGGFSCDVASSAVQAIEMVEKHSYSLILMDLMMSGMDGFEGAKNIRQLLMQSVGSVPTILAVTGLEGDSVLVKQCKEAGMEDIIHKPVSTASLNKLLVKYSPEDL